MKCIFFRLTFISPIISFAIISHIFLSSCSLLPLGSPAATDGIAELDKLRRDELNSSVNSTATIDKEISPPSSESKFNRALTYKSFGRKREAIALLESAWIETRDLEALLALTKTYREVGLKTKALEVMSSPQALESLKNNESPALATLKEEFHLMLAEVYLDLDLPERAIAILDEPAKNISKSQDGLWLRYHAEERANRLPEALQTLRQLEGFNSNLELVFYSQASILKRISSAKDLLSSESKLTDSHQNEEPQRLPVDNPKSDFAENDSQTIERLLLKSIELSPNFTQAQLALAEFQFENKKYAVGERRLSRFEKQFGPKVEVNELLIEFALAQSDWDSAEARLLILARTESKMPLAFRKLSSLYLRQGKLQQAILSLNELIKVDIGDDEARLNLGMTYLANQDIGKSEAVIKDIDPHSKYFVEAKIALADHYKSIGDEKTSYSHLQDIAQYHPHERRAEERQIAPVEKYPELRKDYEKSKNTSAPSPIEILKNDPLQKENQKRGLASDKEE